MSASSESESERLAAALGASFFSDTALDAQFAAADTAGRGTLTRKEVR